MSPRRIRVDDVYLFVDALRRRDACEQGKYEDDVLAGDNAGVLMAAMEQFGKLLGPRLDAARLRELLADGTSRVILDSDTEAMRRAKRDLALGFLMGERKGAKKATTRLQSDRDLTLQQQFSCLISLPYVAAHVAREADIDFVFG